METKHFILITNNETGTVDVYQIEDNKPVYKKAFEVGKLTEAKMKYILWANYIEAEEPFSVLAIEGTSFINYTPTK